MAGSDSYPQTEVLYSDRQICDAVKGLAAQISRDHKSKNPLLIGVLKGSFIFLADLARCLDFPVEIDFVQLSSYGSGTETCGRVKFLKRLTSAVKGRDVIVVEDIVDTGLTLDCLLGYLRRKKPASLKLCVLFDKVARHRVEVKIDYLGFTVPDVFIVGYGIDFDEKFRHLPSLRYLNDKDTK